MARAHALRLAIFIALVAVCLSCSGPSTTERRADGVVTVTGEGACRTLTLEAGGTPSGELVQANIDPAQPFVGYLIRPPEVVWWHATGAVDGHGHVEFVADEGSGSFDIVADPDQKIRVVSASPGMPAGDQELHVTSLSLTWTVQYDPARPEDPPPTIGIRVRVSPFPDGRMNRCLTYTCDPETGPEACSPLADGTLCTDTNTCNGVETCDGEGSCRSGTNAAQGTSCADSNACNGEETCNGSGLCVSGTPLTEADIDDGNACSTDSCDPEHGIVHEPIAGCFGPTDDDGDDMLDDWEMAHGISPLVPNGYEDADGDGYPNVFEYAYATDPSNAASVPVPTYVVNRAGGGTHTTISDAVNAADVQNGGYQIIGIAPGVYKGVVNLRGVNFAANKPNLLIIGLEGASKTIIDGGKIGFGWYITNSVVISSLTFQNTRGALFVQAPTKEVRLVDLLVRDNATPPADWSAPGLYVASAGKVHVVGSTFLNNSGSSSAEQIYVYEGAATLANTVVWGATSNTMLAKGASATLTAKHCFVKGQTLVGTGNLAGTVDPKLRSDARLRSDSPLRGAGANVAQSRLDIDRELRPSTAPDIGVDQFNDSDGDALADAWELATVGNLTTIAGAADADGDGVSNATEYDLETDWLDDDTDGDGIKDGIEVSMGLKPALSDADDLSSDLNHDGVIDSVGAQLGYQPNQLDNDGDGLLNADEVLACTNPLQSDTDGDGVPDNTDVFPFDPLMSSVPSNPQDVTPPVITLTSPWSAVAQ